MGYRPTRPRRGSLTPVHQMQPLGGHSGWLLRVQGRGGEGGPAALCWVAPSWVTLQQVELWGTSRDQVTLGPSVPTQDHKSPGNKVARDAPNSASCDMGWTGPRFLDLSDGLGGLLRVTAPCGLQLPQQLVPSCVSVRVCARICVRTCTHVCLGRCLSFIRHSELRFKYFIFQASFCSFSQQPHEVSITNSPVIVRKLNQGETK